MIHLGQYQTLTVAREVDFGLYLACEQGDEVLLPKRYCKPHMTIDATVEVFIYLDSEDRLTATTQKPYAKVGQFAALKCIDTNSMGAFLDWGLPKDLLVPFAEQTKKMEVDSRYLVHIHQNKADGRIIASSKLDKFISASGKGYKSNQAVNVIIGNKTDLGYKCIVEGQCWGMLFFNDVVGENLTYGHTIKAFIKRVRPDEKIDLSLKQQGYATLEPLAELILEQLKQNKGQMAVSDKSSPEVIKSIFNCSKREFKMAIGSLFKQKLINLEKTHISFKK